MEAEQPHHSRSQQGQMHKLPDALQGGSFTISADAGQAGLSKKSAVPIHTAQNILPPPLAEL